ncbi:MAG TPA: hypothetical protein VK084_02945 [Chitinophagaceae bacterium]|nr:hypothetical protein [Chitinophagaceae bacterium]
MRKYLLYIGVVLGFFMMLSCGKDSTYPSTPYLKYDQIYPVDTVLASERVQITCTFKDAEGDIKGKNHLFYKGINITRPASIPDTFSSYGKDIPVFVQSKDVKGELVVFLKPTMDFPANAGYDSLCFELYLKDKAGHFSDTVRTDTIVMSNLQ